VLLVTDIVSVRWPLKTQWQSKCYQTSEPLHAVLVPLVLYTSQT